MKIELLGQTEASRIAKLILQPGERVRIDPRARINMKPGVVLEAAQEGSLATPEGIDFGVMTAGIATYAAAPSNGGEGWLAPPWGGVMEVVNIDHMPLDIWSGSILAADPGVRLELRFQTLKGAPVEQVAVCRAGGSGEVLLAFPGALLKKTLSDMEQTIVPLTALAACDAGMRVEISMQPYSIFHAGGMKFIDLNLTGPGQLVLSHRSADPISTP
jgi:uncharacterized protein (AIM24 family)